MGCEDLYIEQRIAADYARYPAPQHGMTLNFAVGRFCTTWCDGCFHEFGTDSVVTAAEVLGFAREAQKVGVSQITLYGGDPLTNPEIVQIVQGLHAQGFRVKVDTDGTVFLGAARIVHKGRGFAPAVDVNEIAPYAEVSIPLDVWADKDDPLDPAPHHFRKGRPNLFREKCVIAGLLRATGRPFGINTVAHAGNIHKIPKIIEVAAELGATAIQIFEFDPEGPNPSAHRAELILQPGEFERQAVRFVAPEGSDIQVVCKPFKGRPGTYFLIREDGEATVRIPGGERRRIGHIVRDQDVVLAALREHNKAKAWKAEQYPEVGVGLFVIRNGQILLAPKSIGGNQFEYGGFGGVFERLISFDPSTLRHLVRREAGRRLKVDDPLFMGLSHVTRFALKRFMLMNFLAECKSGEPTARGSVQNWEWYPMENPPEPLGIEARHMLEAIRTQRMFFEDRDRDEDGNYVGNGYPIPYLQHKRSAPQQPLRQRVGNYARSLRSTFYA